MSEPGGPVCDAVVLHDEDDVATARKHAAAMTELIEKYRNGLDTDADGSVEPAMMEGGLSTALQHAELGGF